MVGFVFRGRRERIGGIEDYHGKYPRHRTQEKEYSFSTIQGFYQDTPFPHFDGCFHALFHLSLTPDHRRAPLLSLWVLGVEPVPYM